MKIDGATSSSSPGSYATAINNRLAVPSDIAIDVNMVGDASGGVAYVSVTAEEAPPSGTVKVYTVIVEDHEIASSSWGYYSGDEMMWIPVTAPLGNTGTVLNFTGPYPQTIDVQGNYTLSPTANPFENLNVATYVQLATGAKTMLNANYIDLPDTSTGIYGDESGTIDGNSVLGAWPNPSTGAFAVSSLMPAGVSGSVEIFDIAGRSIEQFGAGSVENIFIEETGVYFIRLTTSTGDIVRRQVAVVR